MSFPRYPAYKTSGVAWLGEVPEHWTILPIKHLVGSIEQGWSPQCEANPAESGQWGVLKVGCVNGGVFNPDENKALPTDLSPVEALSIRDGDILVSRANTRELVGSAAVADQDYDYLLLCDKLYRLRVKPTICSPLFLAQYLGSAAARSVIERAATGASSSMLNIGQPGLVNMQIPLPPLGEQQALLHFIVTETAKIDALIAEQQRLIALLQEKRQAVISHAVTKGLDPDAPMKDSGVEWLGEVPEHWEICPLKSEIFFQEGPGIMAVDFMEEGVPLLRVSCVQGERVTLEGCNYLQPQKVAQKWSHFAVAEGDLLLSGSASLGCISEAGKDVEGSIPYTGLIRIRPSSERISKDYIKLLIESSIFTIQIDRLKAGATIQHFGPTHLRQMKITLPPPVEQHSIVRRTESIKASFHGLIEKAMQAVSLLQERRSALISSAVTGQIDVRGLAPEAEAA